MDLSPNQMLRLAPNKVDYLIPGGEMINEFLGEGPGARVCSQMWIASLVTSALQPGTATGLSRVAGTDVLLRDCLAENPAAWLGEAHAARWGASLGFLLKLLHSGTACCSRPIRTGRGRGSISACPPGRMRRGTCWTPVRGRASGWGSGPASRRRISGG
ncbi:MAG: hypothetical protein ACLRWQ_19170 [Flavonifractor plautii]